MKPELERRIRKDRAAQRRKVIRQWQRDENCSWLIPDTHGVDRCGERGYIEPLPWRHTDGSCLVGLSLEHIVTKAGGELRIVKLSGRVGSQVEATSRYHVVLLTPDEAETLAEGLRAAADYVKAEAGENRRE